jgi:hypothetical protein
MAELVADYLRCGSQQITFDITSAIFVDVAYDWQNRYEVFGVCRHCRRSVNYELTDSVNSDNNYVQKTGLLNVDRVLNN